MPCELLYYVLIRLILENFHWFVVCLLHHSTARLELARAEHLEMVKVLRQQINELSLKVANEEMRKRREDKRASELETVRRQRYSKGGIAL